MEKTLLELFEKAYKERKLLYILFEITYKCNFSCKFCFNPVCRGNIKKNVLENEKQPPLSFYEYINFFDKLRDIGVLFLTFSGGEPLLHPQFFELIEEAQKRAFCIRIFTNGSLIDREKARKLRKLNIFALELSIYGIDEETYEAVTGDKRNFKKVFDAIKILKEEEVRFYLKCLLTKITEKRMDEIQKFADDNGLFLRWDPVVSPSEGGFLEPLEFRASYGALERLFKEEKFKMRNEPYFDNQNEESCTIGRNSLTIDPYGNIHPCVEWKEKLGNIRENDILEIWEKSERLKEIMNMAYKVYERIEKESETPSYCFHCLGRSRILYGDPLKPDPYEIKIGKIKKETNEKEL